ncbi:MAG: DNA polymerase I [Chlamydiae bacterium]|nr:DNA polymerase I [Chlamydiota bacterium]
MKTIYLVDALNILFRSYYAIGPMTNPKGQSTNALYGFIRSIHKVIKDFHPTHLCIIFDGPSNKQKRTAIYAEYKSHRKPMPDDLVFQLQQAIEFCKIAEFPHLWIEGVEADDTIGSVVKWAQTQDATTYIITGDKDLCQLVNKSTFVINPSKDNLLIDEKKVEELFCVKTEQIVDYLAIMGDASDNIPGIEGFGPKTASQLLQKFGTLENLLAHPEQVPGEKKQQILRESKEIALLSKQLATIHTDVPVPEDEKFYALIPHDVERLKKFYKEMHFNSLLKELDSSSIIMEKSHAQKEEPVSYTLVEEEKSLHELCQKLSHAKELCVDTETTDIQPMQASLVGVGIGMHPKEAWYIPLNGKLSRDTILTHLKLLLENKHTSIYGHNIKYDLHVLLNEGISPVNICFDTMLASYILSPHNQRHNLDDLSLENFGKVKIPISDLIGKGKKEIGMQEVEIEKVSTYCCEDVDYTCRLKDLFQRKIKEEGLSDVLEKIELPLLPVLLSMERTGIFVDKHKLEEMSTELSATLETLQNKIYHLAGESFNLNSPKQLSVVLFEKLGLKPPKKTQTGFSTSADVLEDLKDESPIVEEILEYRTLEKLRSTYIDVLPTQINPKTHRIHCTFNQSVAATGRLSCQNPNLQNIPIRSKEGKKIREAFKPQKKDWSFLSADYSQIELRILAHLSEDPSLLKAFNAGEDIHAYTASLVFDVPLQEVTSEMRHQAKAVNFGILYGQQAFGLSQGLSMSFKEAAKFIETYFSRYKKVKEFLDLCKENTRKTGRSVTMTGRQRPIPEINNKNPMIRGAAERLAVNTPLQGTVADLIKIAMIQIDEILKKRPDLGFMILQIHDELLFEIPDEKIEEVSKIVKRIMENVFSLKVPLVVDISVGKNWGEC